MLEIRTSVEENIIPRSKLFCTLYYYKSSPVPTNITSDVLHYVANIERGNKHVSMLLLTRLKYFPNVLQKLLDCNIVYMVD